MPKAYNLQHISQNRIKYATRIHFQKTHTHTHTHTQIATTHTKHTMICEYIYVNRPYGFENKYWFVSWIAPGIDNSSYYRGFYTLVDTNGNQRIETHTLSSTFKNNLFQTDNPGIAGCVSKDYNTLLIILTSQRAPLTFQYVTYPTKNINDTTNINTSLLINNLPNYISDTVTRSYMYKHTHIQMCCNVL